jgi:basic membrane protein A
MNSIFKLPHSISNRLVIFFCLLSLSQASGVVFAADAIKVALVLDRGGKDDKSFNSAAYQGAMKAKSELNVFVKYVEATDDNASVSLLRSFAQKDFDLIIAVGFNQAEAVKKVATQFPQKKFALVDGQVSLPNVRSLIFEEHEGAFIVGAIAAQVSKTGVVGFIGGMDIPLIRRFEKGFIAGAQNINPQIKVISNFIGMTSDAWNNPARAKELAISQYNSKADVIFASAGASSSGIFDAAEEKKKFAIGVDSNQNGVKPGYILTSMVKRVDQAVFATCKDAQANQFSGGLFKFGLANQGVDYTVDSNNEKILPVEVRKKADGLKAQIVSGKIKVPDYLNRKTN